MSPNFGEAIRYATDGCGRSLAVSPVETLILAGIAPSSFRDWVGSQATIHLTWVGAGAMAG